MRALAALALALLCGCGSLPTIVPDLSLHPRQAVRLEGARGPLSESESAAVMARLKSRGQETSIFERHLAHEEAVAGTPLMVGNKVVLLKDGPATYQAMFNAIAGARDHINMETYIFEDDEIGQKFAAALIAKRSQGVQVNFIYDSVGSMGVTQALFGRLEAAGVNVLEFNPINPLVAGLDWSVNQRDHRKLLVIDGRVAFMGGVNISSVYSAGSFRSSSRSRADGTPPWRDTHLQIEGPVVAEFQKLFLRTWEKQKGKPLAPSKFFPDIAVQGNEVVRAIGSSSDEQYTLMYATLLSAIGSAQTSVNLTNAYFVPDPQLLAALLAAAARGVDVRLLLPGATDSWLVFHAGRAHYDELLRGGVKIHERRGAMLHAKTAVIDGVWSTVGSTNLDWRSFLHNDEVNAVIVGPEFGARMQAMFDDDVSASQLMTPQAWRRRPLRDRASEFAAQVWKYWL